MLQQGLAALLILVSSSSLAQDFFNTDSCGQSLGCWTFPTNCKPEECHGIVRWRVEGDKIHLDLQAKDLDNSVDVGRYISVGISEDAIMDNDTVIECIFKGGKTVDTFISYNDHHDNVQLYDASTNLLELVSGARHDERMMCQVILDYGNLRKVQEGERETVKDIREGEWVLIFAQGAADLKTGEKYMHSYYPWSTQELVQFCADCDRSVTVVERTFPQRARRMRK
ncbi:unnamed protein product [Bursaphelenchus xylophilus]|uniref:(pine wood nematode) hypothetical protein n=1 Tax=Bursaphelenchus xylophilus TaxID=6326 RepID=A0A1I7SW64_BURXY|nr:unnamed protein product [Bursaphelenchus xylophilus]CAG9098891.1 unnamed protein product [Bursaphelenchus xylophilus]